MPDGFHVRAEIHTVYDVPISKERLIDFLSKPDTFEKYMPCVQSLQPVGTSETGKMLYEWQYEIQMPLAPPAVLNILTEYVRAGDTLLHTALQNGQRNTMFCSLSFEAQSDEQTFVTMKLMINLQRNSGSELHPLGIIMGEGFMSSQMQQKMQTIANEFLQNTVNALSCADSVVRSEN
jgi:hypothetical protein